jgi:hypothetical protein
MAMSALNLICEGRHRPQPTTETLVKTQDVGMTAIMKTREERRKELKQLAAMANGIDKLYLILTRNFIPFKKLPIGTLIIEAILDHEYPGRK